MSTYCSYPNCSHKETITGLLPLVFYKQNKQVDIYYINIHLKHPIVTVTRIYI